MIATTTPTIDPVVNTPAGFDAYLDIAAYLDIDGAARHLGVKPGTVSRYRAGGIFPPPDVMLGRSPGWLPVTLERWRDARPGQGAGGGRPRKDQTTAPGRDDR